MKKFNLRMTLAGLLLSTAIIATGCGGNSSTGGSSSGGTESGGSSSEAPAAVDPIEFSLGHMNSTEHVQDSMVKRPFTEEVAEITGGNVTFQIYPGGALSAPVETWDNIVTGIMDAGWALQGYNAGKFPVHSVLHLPFLAEGNAADLSVVAQKLYDEFPEIQAEYDEVKVLWVHAADPYAIITRGKAVRSIDDVKGLRLRAPSVESGAMIESWGATPVSMPAPEIYDAMQKGVIDGGVLPVAAIADFNLYDVVDYVTIGNFNTALFYTVMNKNSWAKVSSEDQEKIESLIGVRMAETAGEAFDYQREQAAKKAEETGAEFITLTEEQLQPFKDSALGVTEKWLADMEAKGIDGQKIYDRAVELMKGN